MSKIIGIDLGTTNSCAAVLEGSSVDIIPNDIGGRTTPSVVAFGENGERLIGQVAKRQSVINASSTITGIKRLMARRYDSEEIKSLRSHLTYGLASSENGDVRITVRGKSYSPPEISAMILQRIKSMAENFLHEEVREAIITVPAYFDDSQRQATKDAGKIAGLEVRRIINEPTAAALAYGIGRNERERIAIFDLGGGTFDISILELNDGVFEVLATCGDSFLGGEDFDQRIIEWMIAEFESETGVCLGNDAVTRQRLKETAESVKCELTLSGEAHINLPFIGADSKGPKHLSRILSRTNFEELVQSLIERTTAYCEQALSSAQLTAADIDKVILVGGQTRTPAVQKHVERIFGKKPSIEVNPDEVVAVGAALQGGVLRGDLKEIVLLDVLPLSLGVETQGGLFTRIIEHNSTIPLKKTTEFTTVADNQAIVEVHVLQGERELAKDNRSLARFDLVGIAPAPRGVPQIDVTFDIDANGIVSVSAKDKVSGKEQAIRITPSTGLSQEEIERMIAEAKDFADSDRQSRQVVELHNRVQGRLSIILRSYSEFGRYLDSEEHQVVKNAIQKARALRAEETDIDLIKDLTAELEHAAALLTSAIFSAPSGSGLRAEEEAAPEDTAEAMDRLVKSAMNDARQKS